MQIIVIHCKKSSRSMCNAQHCLSISDLGWNQRPSCTYLDQ